MVLVAGEHRRRGLGTRLLHRCIDDLAGAGLVPVLDATPAGRALYLALGFEDAWGLHRLAAARAAQPQRSAASEICPRPTASIIRPIADAVWPGLCAYDAAAFGADRSGVLARLRGRLPAAELFAERDGRVAVSARPRRPHATQVGPLVAENDAIARALLARALDALDGPIYIDLADAKTGIRALARSARLCARSGRSRACCSAGASFDDPRARLPWPGRSWGEATYT